MNNLCFGNIFEEPITLAAIDVLAISTESQVCSHLL